MDNRAFDHVLIIMFENQYRGYVLQNPYMANLAQQGIELTNSFGVMHPSQTNYISSIAGELCDVSDDDAPSPLLKQQTIVDLIEASPRQLRWKAYMDSYIADNNPWQPENFTPTDHYPYVIKHNPFSSFENIVTNKQRWQQIDNEAGFWRDLLNDNLPEYAWFTPNMWNDGHYLAGTTDDTCNGERAPVLVDQQASWLKSFFAGLNFPGPHSKLPPNTLVVVTYDEADFEAFFDKGKKYTYDGPNQVYTVLLGDNIRPGKEHQGYNHYSLLKTIEKNFNLGSLNKNDRDANYFQFLWGKSFAWQPPRESGLSKVKQFDACSFNKQLLFVALEHNNQLTYRLMCGDMCGEETNLARVQALPLADNVGQAFALAANDQQALLVYGDTDGLLKVLSYDLATDWRSVATPAPEADNKQTQIRQLDLVALPDNAGFLLVYQTRAGSLFGSRFSGAPENAWQAPEKLCHIINTPIALGSVPVPVTVNSNISAPFKLARLGASILLVYSLPHSNHLSCLSYNTAEFNKVKVKTSAYSGPYDDYTVNAWSASSFTLNVFGETPPAASQLITPEQEPEPTEQGLVANGQFALQTLDGVIHLLHNAGDNPQLLSSTFSIGGTLTPGLPVSYQPDAPGKENTSDGYGTLFEAGWSQVEPVRHIIRDQDSPIAMANFNDQLWLFYQGQGQESINICRGGYHHKAEQADT
ncbi:alkaline phosphatase family protein [Thalassomonas actiniarum]|uniref:Phosphoesterase n=1 Tax=Thalassomonas actiniarum TaxID=485447 RepID=A0AAE9YT41_9GAMM|nr:alkaline phosphatase family protein [Thalassomonas actiniarum]WDE00730.1 hypothetical protein SG35_008910 [Thalassomonas actiniarum]